MNIGIFNWGDIYEEFATRLLKYKNNRKGLISKIQNVYEEIDMKLPKMESNGKILDIDPFTIFGLFNKGITDDNRKRILGEIAKQFNLKNKLPSSFDGIPLVDNRRAAFFYFEEERGENDIDNLNEEKIKDMISFASAAASIVTTKKGAICSMPEIEEVEKLRKKYE